MPVVFTIDIIGAPGCGKTALPEATVRDLQPRVRCAVIVGDLATQREADRMAGCVGLSRIFITEQS